MSAWWGARAGSHRSARPRGGPLAMLGLVLASWVAGRAAVWESPLAVPDEELDAKAVEIATRLAEGAPSAIRFTKYALNNWYRMAGPSFDASLALEFLGFSGPEAREGLASHKEKRRPSFDPDVPL